MLFVQLNYDFVMFDISVLKKSPLLVKTQNEEQRYFHKLEVVKFHKVQHTEIKQNL
jgi:hypothetical protein